MASWFKDKDFQRHLLTFICRDRNFLKSCGGMLQPKDFRPNRDESDERYVIATLALEFWRKYKDPIAGMLRPEVADFVRKNAVDDDRKKQLYRLVDKINSGEKLVAVAAMEDRVIAYLRDKKVKDSIEKIVSKHEEGELDPQTLVSICKEVIEWSGAPKRAISNFIDSKSLDNRIARRSLSKKKKFPLLFIDEIDSKTRAIGRGDLGLILALYKMGKSMCLAHLADAYAKQGLNVLYFTLEDPVDEVEDRMDAALANMPIDRLNDLPNRLRKRFKKFSKLVTGRIKIVDGTDEGMSVDDIEQVWESERDQGFTADVVIVDYDEYMKPPVVHKGESAKRQEFNDMYKAYRRFLSRRGLIGWLAAQTNRIKESTKIVTGSMAAEDLGKIRKATMVIGIGQGEEHIDARYFQVVAHKRGRSKFGVALMASPEKGLIFDRDRTSKLIWSTKKEKP